MIKAIETNYKGYMFRSRLEARWAVFFDEIGLKWEYEVEGFELEDGTWYLPDFYIPHFGYIEIKASGMVNDDEINKCIMLSKKPINIALFEGTPSLVSHKNWYNGEETCAIFFCDYSVVKWEQIPFYTGDAENVEQKDLVCEVDEKAYEKARSYRF